MHLRVTPLTSPPTDTLPFEIVERKGRGHPDTLCDSLAEAVSAGLSRDYLERFGVILHHNVDKALLLGGKAKPAFGAGEVLEPIDITLAGRATRHFRGVTIPVETLAVEHCRAWLNANLVNLDPKDIRITVRIRETSPDLAALFSRRGDRHSLLANDTSFGVGFAPLDALERAVLAVERRLTSPAVKHEHPAIGDDVKVMGWRSESAVKITVACAFVGRHVLDLADYHEKKRQTQLLAAGAAQGEIGMPAAVDVNTGDGDTPDSIYLTVTGLSAEGGDDGQVGRGNRVNGLITPYRPMSLEAAAGKNPVTHPGKLYNLLADRIARALVAEMPAIAEARCCLLSRIGLPLNEPAIADISIRLADPASIELVEASCAEIVRGHLAIVHELWREIVTGRCAVC